jgi:excisionase family DNA binding protein
LISSGDAAVRLGVSQATVLRAVAKGSLRPTATTPGGHHRFRTEDVDALAGALSVKPHGNARLISTGEAARLLGVSQHTVIRAVNEGRLEPDETTPGGHHRFSEERIWRMAPGVGLLVGTGGAARLLGLSVERLLKAVQQGTVRPVAITPGGHRRFASWQLLSMAEASKGDGAG